MTAIRSCARCRGLGRIIRWGHRAKKIEEVCRVCNGSGQATNPYYNPVSHKTDPPTSQAAADQHEASGLRSTNAERVLVLVRQWPGRTATDLANRCDLTLTEVRRRLTDLMHRDSVRQGERRGREVTWYPQPHDKYTGARV